MQIARREQNGAANKAYGPYLPHLNAFDDSGAPVTSTNTAFRRPRG
jgi:hypothetical protein